MKNIKKYLSVLWVLVVPGVVVGSIMYDKYHHIFTQTPVKKTSPVTQNVQDEGDNEEGKEKDNDIANRKKEENGETGGGN